MLPSAFCWTSAQHRWAKEAYRKRPEIPMNTWTQWIPLSHSLIGLLCDIEVTLLLSICLFCLLWDKEKTLNTIALSILLSPSLEQCTAFSRHPLRDCWGSWMIKWITLVFISWHSDRGESFCSMHFCFFFIGRYTCPQMWGLHICVQVHIGTYTCMWRWEDRSHQSWFLECLTWPRTHQLG